MSLKSVVALVDDKLHEVFHRKQPDAKKARQRALKTVETARRQFSSPDATKGRKVWAVSNEVVRFTPGYRITERETLFVPASRFNDMLDNLEAAIKAGELDDALLAEPNSESSPERAPRKQRTRDPASTAMAVATRAANKGKGVTAG